MTDKTAEEKLVDDIVNWFWNRSLFVDKDDAHQLVQDLKLVQLDDDQSLPEYCFSVAGYPVRVDVERIARKAGFKRIRR